MRIENRLEFNEENHVYTLDGIILPSVSEIIEPIHKKVYKNICDGTLEKAADKGTRAHRAIEFFNKYQFKNLDEDCKGYFEAYKKFRDEHKDWKLIDSELRIYHKNLLYGMTIDEVYETPQGIVISDIKTTAQSHPGSWSVQLSAYKAGYESQFKENVSQIQVLQIKNTGEYVLYNLKDNFSIFLTCLQIHRFEA